MNVLVMVPSISVQHGRDYINVRSTWCQKAGGYTANILKIDIRITVNHNTFCQSRQHMLHFSAVLTVFRR